MQRRRLVDWAFGHYLAIASPDFAEAAPQRQPWARAA
jgi:hypothetical protein